MSFIEDIKDAGNAYLNPVGYWDDFTGNTQIESMNAANQGIASARNVFESEEAKLARAHSTTEAEKNRAFQKEEIQRQLNFEERMSNSAVTRRMADMKEAGINPILAGKFDATSPSGSAGSGSQGPSPKANSAQATMAAKPSGAEQLSSAIGIAKQFADLNKTTADTQNVVQNIGIKEPASGIAKDADKIYKIGKDAAAHFAPKVAELYSNTAKQVKKITKGAKDAVKKSIGHGVGVWDRVTNRTYWHDKYGNKSITEGK